LEIHFFIIMKLLIFFHQVQMYAALGNVVQVQVQVPMQVHVQVHVQ
jgi:hypothetical protein